MSGYIRSPRRYYLSTFLLLHLIFFNNASGAFEERLLSTRASAMGGAYSALSSDQLALFGNVANLSKQNQLQFNVIYMRPFGLKELSQSGLMLAIPSRGGVIGIAASRFGFSLYHENVLSVGYAQKIYQRISIGLSLHYMEVQIKNYGAGRSLGLNSGISADLTENLVIGLTIRNMNSPNINAEDNSLPLGTRLGLSYTPAGNLKLITEYQKEKGFGDIIRVGAEIELIPSQFLRFGVSNNPSNFSIGFGLTSNGITIDYAALNHQFLGISQNLSVGFSF